MFSHAFVYSQVIAACPIIPSFSTHSTDSRLYTVGVIWNPWAASECIRVFWNRPGRISPQHSLISHEYLPIRRMPITPFLTPQTSSQSLSLIWALSQYRACDSELLPMQTEKKDLNNGYTHPFVVSLQKPFYSGSFTVCPVLLYTWHFQGSFGHLLSEKNFCLGLCSCFWTAPFLW